MMQDEDWRDITNVLGRPLNDSDLKIVSDVQALSPEAIDLIRRIASLSKALALKYMLEVVPNTRLGLLVGRLEELLGDSPGVRSDIPDENC